MGNLEFNRAKLERIHQSTVVVDGRKTFGDYDQTVETGSTTCQTEFNPGAPGMAVVVSVMDRREKFTVTYGRLLEAVAMLGVACRIVVMDNSICDGLKEEVEKWSGEKSTETLESVVYCHAPRLTQSGLRNKAVTELSGDAPGLVVCDGDIYLQSQTLAGINLGLENLDGAAPVMVGFNGGRVEDTLKKYMNVADDGGLRRQAHMPGEIGEEIWVREEGVMRATMMRGCFGVNRIMVDRVAQTNPYREAWMQDFVVWQNVPFWIRVRELGGDFGYILDGNMVVAHDDRVDGLSVGYRMPYRVSETLKALTMLMHMNRVYTPEGQELNQRFLSYNIGGITRVLQTDGCTAAEVQRQLLRIAELVSTSTNSREFVDGYKVRIKSDIPEVAGESVDVMVAGMMAGNAWERIKICEV